MTTQTEALKLALEALENTTPTGFNMETDKRFFAAIAAIKEALAQPEQEPVACVGPWHDGRLTLIPRYSHKTFEREQPLYTTPPQRTWVGLTFDEQSACYEKSGGNLARFAKAIEAKLKEKNT